MGKSAKLSGQHQDNEPGGYHVPVLLDEVIAGLHIQPDGVYVDATFGGGGHSRSILSHLSEHGKLYVFDQDDDARQNLPDDDRVIFIPQNFRHLQRMLRLHRVTAIDGLLADLGVSSHQFDEADRGFSTRFDADLDMRMDQRNTITAYQLLNTYSEEDLHRIFEQYGEVTNSKTLARTIVAQRKIQPFKTIQAFKLALRDVVKGNPNKYFAQVFQALRIEVNDELDALKELLEQSVPLLKPQGRLAIITFHSLEDRLVKQFIKQGSFEQPVENPFINNEEINLLKAINKKPITASEKELKTNSRSRSAKLRIAEKRSGT